MKICKDCKKKKNESDFYGIQGECKVCTKTRVSKNYRKNKSHYQSYDKARNLLPERKKKKLEYQSKTRKNHKGKYKARNKVSNAIRDGKLKRLPCVICGDPKSEAHHLDYRSKLKVVWLCQKHHRQVPF